AQIGVGPVDRNGASRPGALPASADSLKNSLDQISMLRAYGPELTGWFDDFGHSGFPDAFGGIGRISTTLNAFSAGPPSAGIPCNDILGILGGTCQALSGGDLASGLGLKYLQRCPGSNERGLSEEQLTQGGTVNCNPSQTPLGP
ncbi:MAG TPA: hypothetical protein VHR38_14315, partial [Solirubrobacterales bacterium]|nr:hypothetical protein [Solirubrobacterales bacterium]